MCHWWACKVVQLVWKASCFPMFNSVLNMELPYDAAVSLLREMKTCPHKNLHLNVHNRRFIIAKCRSNPNIHQLINNCYRCAMDFPGGSNDKASAYNAGDPGSIPGSERSPGKGNGDPLQCSCLENPMDRGAW